MLNSLDSVGEDEKEIELYHQLTVVQLCRREAFCNEYKALVSRKPMPLKSPLIKLNTSWMKKAASVLMEDFGLQNTCHMICVLQRYCLEDTG
ncbi:unnamed protein product [Porites lobata]|uniref:Uncharacterized protein n=1 Tax=Porites lobata TaxID=104759 RepID=A0ABN8NZK5_9CNID|nr:unnamed protein product [Porites lobata]